jgi:putative metallopeptidase DUF4344
LSVALAAGCGSGSSSSSTAAETHAAIGASGASGAAGPTIHPVAVTYEKPANKSDALGYQLLKANKLEYIGNALANTFELPHTLTVKGVDGFGSGPFFNPKDNSITFPYGFAALVFQTVTNNNPNLSQYQVGTNVGAIDSFILEHEFGHALIANFNLPVLGKEEDAADTIATILLLKAKGGAEYAFDAARFWADFSGRQKPPALADYADVHSLDLQRAFDILCDVAGSSQSSFRQVAGLHILPTSRLQSCPAEYKQAVDSITAELQPHLKKHINLQAR